MSTERNAAARGNMPTQYLVHNASLAVDCVSLRFNESQHLPWDNPDDFASQKVEQIASAVKDLMLGFLCLIGGPANVINMAVFYKQGLQERVNLCLFMLAVSDEIFLISSMFLHGENIYLYMSGQVVTSPVNEFMANNNLIFIPASGYVSYALSGIIACERCYCVLRPLKYQTLLSTRTMAGIIICLFLSVFSLFFIVSYRYWVQCAYDPVTDEVMMIITGGGFYRNHKQLIDVLDGGVFGAGLPGVLMIVVITSTIITTVKLRQIVTWRSETTSLLSPREVALTKMLIGNSVFFIICISPVCAFRFAYLFLPGMTAGGQHHNFYFTTVWVLESSSFVNSSLNVFIYYSMGSRYRETLWALLSKKTARGKKSNGR